MEQKVRVTVECTVIDQKALDRMRQDFLKSEDEFNEPGKVKDAKVTFEEL